MGEKISWSTLALAWEDFLLFFNFLGGDREEGVNEGQSLHCCFYLCLLFDMLVRNCNCQLVNTVNQHADVTGVQPCTTPWESPSDFYGFSPSSPSECNSDQGNFPPLSSKNLHFLYKSEGKTSLWPSIKLTIQSASHLLLRAMYLCIFCTTFL